MEFGRGSACEGPFDLIREPLGPHNAFGCMIYSIFLMHKRAARVDLGSHGGVAFQSPLRATYVFVRKMNVLCVLGADWQP